MYHPCSPKEGETGAILTHWAWFAALLTARRMLLPTLHCRLRMDRGYPVEQAFAELAIDPVQFALMTTSRLP